MFRLASHLEIPTLALSALSESIQKHNYALLTKKYESPFSAVTIFLTYRRRAIVFNDSNAATRQQSDLAHELAHAILDHPHTSLTDSSGGRHYDNIVEAEASCLSGILLVPRPAAIKLATAQIPLNTAAASYNISPAMLRMRLNQSGAMKIAARSSFTK